MSHRLAVVLALALAAPAPVALAQRVRRPPPDRARKAESEPAGTPKPGEPPVAPPAEAKPQGGDDTRFSLFGDASKFSRVGGWGGLGATMGQFGFGPSMLVMTPAVQKELGLDDDQKKALKEWSEQMRDQGREMAQGLRQEGEAAFQRMDIPAMMQLMGHLNELLQENEQGIGRILTRKQWTRLQQISLQMEGLTALKRPDVAEALLLAPEQLEDIHEILAQAQLRQMGFWMQQGLAMRERAEAGRRRGEPRPPRGDDAGDAGDAPPEAAPESTRAPEPAETTTKARDPEAAPTDEDDAARAKRRREMRTQFTAMRDGADRMHQETIDRLLKVLTRRQRSQFEKMLGPPFNPDALTEGWERRRDGDAGERKPDRPANAAAEGPPADG